MKTDKSNRLYASSIGVTFTPQKHLSRLVRLIALSAFVAAVCNFAFVPRVMAQGANAPIVISEVRTRGSAGASDEFVEIFNTTTEPIDISGYTLRGSSNAGATSIRATVPAGTTLQSRQYYLFVNASYNDAVPGNQTFSSGIVDDGGVAIFDSSATSIDQVGFSAGSAFREGTFLAPKTTNTDTSYIRRPATSGGDLRNAQDTGDNSADFGTLTASDPQNTGTTHVKLIALQAFQSLKSSTLVWQTGFEVDNLGFNIYRESDGRRVRLNDSIIAGSALRIGAGTPLVAGQTYSWRDAGDYKARRGARYWLEDIDLNGRRTWHGAVGAVDGNNDMEMPPSVTFKQLALRGKEIDSPRERQFVKSAVARVSDFSSSSSSALQQTLAAQAAVKIAVRRAGWYRVTQAELVAAGLDANADPRKLQLYADGVEVPMRVAGEEAGRFAADNHIEFYGVGFDTATNDTRVYWLVAGTSAGKRIKLAATKPASRVFRGRTRAASAAAEFPFTVEIKDRQQYIASLLNGDANNFFGHVVINENYSATLNAPNLISTSNSKAKLEIALQGLTKGEHRVRVSLNGTQVSTLIFADKENKSASIEVPILSSLQAANTITLLAEAGELDTSFVDYLRLTYPRRLSATDNTLTFSLRASQTARIDDFTSSRLRVLDITRPDDVKEASTTIQNQDGRTSATIGAASSIRTLFAFTEDKFDAPHSVTANNPSNLRDTTNAADMLIVTTKALRASVEPLAVARRAQNLNVAVIDVEDVFDEWNFGHPHSPPAIREFLRFTKEQWQTAPRFVLLVGDSSYDSRGYIRDENIDVVPTKLIDTANMETASDEWLVDFDEDGLGEIAIGRLPARNATQADMMIARSINPASPDGRAAVLFADARNRNDGFDFVAINDVTAQTLPASINREQLNRNPDEAATRTEFIDAVNRGALIVNYIGHGSVDLWSGANFFGKTDAANLTNGARLPFFALMTCLNGFYQDPAADSLAEALLKAENGGAIAVWASSGMTVPQSQALINQELYRGLFADSPLTLGEAVRGAKAATEDFDVRRTWILFGDPSARLR